MPKCRAPGWRTAHGRGCRKAQPLINRPQSRVESSGLLLLELAGDFEFSFGRAQALQLGLVLLEQRDGGLSDLAKNATGIARAGKFGMPQTGLGLLLATLHPSGRQDAASHRGHRDTRRISKLGDTIADKTTPTAPALNAGSRRSTRYDDPNSFGTIPTIDTIGTPVITVAAKT